MNKADTFRLCEVVFDATLTAWELANDGLTEYGDSRELLAFIYDIAKEFEEQWVDYSGEDYLISVGSFSRKKLLERYAIKKEKNPIQAALWSLRLQVTLGSVYISDYENDFGIARKQCAYFFDGYLSYLEELMKEDNVMDADFYEELPNYDNEDNLYAWYLCIDDPKNEIVKAMEAAK